MITVAAGMQAGPLRAEPGDRTAGLAVGGTLLALSDRWRPGLLVHLEGRYGLGEAWAVRAGLGGGVHPTETPAVRLATATAGLVYAWDVVRMVPFGEAGLALTGLDAAGRRAWGFVGAQLGVGVGYLLDRRWSLAGAVRGQLALIQLGQPAMDQPDRPVLLSALLRLERHF